MPLGTAPKHLTPILIRSAGNLENWPQSGKVFQYIDKEGGIAVDDCEVVSREADPILDTDDCIEESYILEVSSPGLGRPLKKDKDFARSIGEEVEVRLFRAVEGCKEYTGLLNAYDKTTVTLMLEDEKTLVLERSNIALIRLALDF